MTTDRAVGDPTVGSWTGSGLAHEAFLFADDGAVRARCVPFVREGLDRGEPVVVVAGDLVRGILQDELGDLVQDLHLLQAAEESWSGGAGTLAAYRTSMQPLLEDGRPWRLIGEPVWLSQPDGSRWSRFEAVANEAFAHYPYYSLCLHDLRRLEPALVDGQLRAHPMVWDGTEPVANPAYVPTETYLRSVEPAWTPAPDSASWHRITGVREALPTLEALVEGPAGAGRSDEVLLAVYELVTNALRAAGEAEVRHWAADGTVVWEVADAGPGMHQAAAGYVPPSEDLDCGRGLWLARSLADDASVRAGGPGTAVRLYFDRAR